MHLNKRLSLNYLSLSLELHKTSLEGFFQLCKWRETKIPVTGCLNRSPQEHGEQYNKERCAGGRRGLTTRTTCWFSCFFCTEGRCFAGFICNRAKITAIIINTALFSILRNKVVLNVCTSICRKMAALIPPYLCIHCHLCWPGPHSKPPPVFRPQSLKLHKYG